ncbi:MAG: SMC-Scp complex subunit ScpB [Rhodospirillales bacterium]
MNIPETTEEITPVDENDPRHLRLLEAILFASAEPVTERIMANRLPEGADVVSLLEKLSLTYADRGVNLVRAEKSWAFRTAPDLSQMLNMEIDVPRKLSRAAVETLAIIAYHQPITRAEIEEVRGVGLSRGTLDVLLEAGWIKPKGRRRTPGRPATWGTTDGFLDHFGIEDVGDLPGMDELKTAGLLESGPAISVYRETTKGAPEKEGPQLELIGNNEQNSEGAALGGGLEEAFDEAEDEASEPLDPDGGEA